MGNGPDLPHLLNTAIIVLLIFWLELVAGYWSPLLNFSAATRGLLFAVLKTALRRSCRLHIFQRKILQRHTSSCRSFGADLFSLACCGFGGGLGGLRFEFFSMAQAIGCRLSSTPRRCSFDDIAAWSCSATVSSASFLSRTTPPSERYSSPIMLW